MWDGGLCGVLTLAKGRLVDSGWVGELWDLGASLGIGSNAFVMMKFWQCFVSPQGVLTVW